ncbi:MAG: hypothetical protein U0L38_00090 [Bacteroidales bacterium]|nr:hypothetical protein [Bacteroidales bacterium]
MGAVATMGFVACNPTSDCNCDVMYGDVPSGLDFTTAPYPATIVEFEGECTEITSSTEGLEWIEEYASYANDPEVTMVCSEQ